MKKISIILMCIIMALSFAACSDDTQTETTKPEIGKTEEVVVNSNENSTTEAESTTENETTTEPVADVLGETPMVKDFLGRTAKEIINYFAADYEITEGYGGAQLFISYKYEESGGWGMLPYNFGIYSETGETEEEILENGKVVTVVLEIKASEPINEEFNTADTYAELKAKTGSKAEQDLMEGGYVLTYSNEEISVVFCWENKPEDDENAEYVIVSKL